MKDLLVWLAGKWKLILIVLVSYLFLSVSARLGHAEDNTEYCKNKAGFAVLAMSYKQQGIGKDQLLTNLQTTQNEAKEHGLQLPHFVYIDYTRVINDVYRAEQLNAKELYTKEFKQCAQVGF